MIKLSNFVSYTLISSFLILSYYQSLTTTTSLGVESNSIQLGRNNKSGVFINSINNVFTAKDKIILKVKAIGLTVKDSKIRTNVDLFFKKDKDILSAKNDILGVDGFSQDVSEVDPGKEDLTLTITPPSDAKGEIIANITLEDLNAQDKISTFETKFTLE